MAERVSNGRALIKIIAALFKNKLRFSENTSKAKKYGTLAAFAIAYIFVLAIAVYMSVFFGRILGRDAQAASLFYLIALFTGGLIVLVFGVVHLVSTLFLCKDTDFYSALPVKSWVVFAAKLLYVYISEVVIVVAVLLPVLIAFGVTVGAWAGYYIITVLTIALVPAFPLAVAAIIAVPIMFIAGKVKHRGLMAILFYVLLFGGFFGLYLYLIYTLTHMMDNITQEQVMRFLRIVRNIGYALYPYITLSYSALGVKSFGLDLIPSTFANLAIFLAISVGLIVVLLFLAKFMYARSAKANNQTDSSKVKAGEFKSAGVMKSLIKREYAVALRTTQTTFQCFAVLFLPIILSVFMGMIFRIVSSSFMVMVSEYPSPIMFLCYAALAAVLPSTVNAAFTSFSREGTYVESLKVLPVSAKSIVNAKILSWLALAVPVAFISMIILGALAFNPLNFGLSMVVMPALTVVFGIFAVLWDLSAPKLRWTDASQAIKHNSHATIGMLLCMVGVFITIITVNAVMNNELLAESMVFRILPAIIWGVLSATALIFAVVDVILYRKMGIYYDRMTV